MIQRPLTKTAGHYEIRGARAIDGDSIEAIILLPFGAMTTKRIRLAGWWAPELNGPNPGNGKAAQAALQRFLDDTVCHIFSKSERTDKYGRVIASLWTNHRPIEPNEVIGLWQLTPEQHKAEADWIRNRGVRESLQMEPEPRQRPDLGTNPANPQADGSGPL